MMIVVASVAAGSSHVPGAVAENFHLITNKRQREGETGPGLGFEIPKPNPATHLL